MAATLGIDLSSQPMKTALCMVEWSKETASVAALWRGASPDGVPLRDGLLIDALRGRSRSLPAPSKAAIDAPLGWPMDFVMGVADPANWPVKIDESRARLERRATDHWVHRAAGKQPLSVTTDRIAYPAMRAAGLLAHYGEVAGHPVDRGGMTGLICETYPDPAIRRFGVWPKTLPARASYKGDAFDVRERILEELAAAAPWLVLSDVDRGHCIEFDDCLDALICALAARAVEQGQTVPPPAELAEEATVEGWIHLPQPGSLPLLL